VNERSGLLSFFSPTAQAEDLETRLRAAGVDRDDIDRLLAALPRTG
jgi:hypothetical protein